MRTLLLGLVLGVVATPALAASPEAALRAPIEAFVAAFNKGDVTAAKATHEANPVIIDEPPPFIWSGRDAIDRWVADQHKEALAQGRTEEKVVIGKTRRAEVEGGSAYVIVPATYSYLEKGVPKEEVSQMTYVLRQTRAGWRIAAWTWTGPRGRAIKPAK